MSSRAGISIMTDYVPILSRILQCFAVLAPLVFSSGWSADDDL